MEQYAKTGAQIWAWDLGNPSITNLPLPGYYYGGKRRDFDDEYNSSIIALDLDTSRRIWGQS
ncbi:hypothetical protein [Nitrosomonas sp. PY1]|uniref:hypothetical protein n=1 Tax=Nitrosomonas sp. PY1 TaxID=1803906 RepID=UPI001FC7F78C|nr:hypothetical protein [Nitrosomonas sp. PY1]